MNLGINIPEYEVSQFNLLFKEVVEKNFDYVRIRGEISELKSASSGHLYLTLKDDQSILNATIWSQKKVYLKIKPEVGMEVIVTGKISTYAKSISTYSINIDSLELAGEGALLKLIEDRKKSLYDKGFFDSNHKKKIPFLPNKIGVITSLTGSVIHDIINRVKDRFPTNIDIWPVAVQGINAAENIINAIKGFNSNDYAFKPSVIIIARGGGSTEDLMPFNDEHLALAVYYSDIPIISAIGHETDTSIIDFISDLRASTPTAAAEKAVPMKNDLDQKILNFSNHFDNLIENKYKTNLSKQLNLSKFIKAPNFIINAYKERFSRVNKNLFKELEGVYKRNISQLVNLKKLLRLPENILEYKKKNLSIQNKNLNRTINSKYTSLVKDLVKSSRILNSNSIGVNLKKGFSIIRKSNKLINNSSLINIEDSLNIQFLDKSINVKIKKI